MSRFNSTVMLLMVSDCESNDLLIHVFFNNSTFNIRYSFLYKHSTRFFHFHSQPPFQLLSFPLVNKIGYFCLMGLKELSASLLVLTLMVASSPHRSHSGSGTAGSGRCNY